MLLLDFRGEGWRSGDRQLVHPHRARLVERTTRLFDSIDRSGDGRRAGAERLAARFL